MAKLNDLMTNYENHSFNPVESFLDQDKDLPTKLVSIYEIDFNPLNDQGDTEEELNDFADAIYEEGQIRSPLNVYKHHGSDGKKYMLLGGDRRLHALLINAEKHGDAQRNVPIIIEKKPQNAIEEELKILELNEHRALTPEREKKLVGRYLRIYRTLESEGNKPSGQVRKWIACRLNIGEKKAEKYIHEIEGYTRKVKTNGTNEKSDEKHENQTNLTSSDKDQLLTIQENLEKHMASKVKVNQKNGSITFYGEKGVDVLDNVYALLSFLGFDENGNYGK